MLTESGYRESLAEERVRKAFAAAGAPPDALATLVDRRLLRIEERLDMRRVELTHDVLCGVVRASRDLRHEREARDEAERQLAAQKERERATRKALVRARRSPRSAAVLAIVAVAGAIFGYVNMKRAQDAEANAQRTQQLAESARGEAEKLVVFLLDDFYLELEPVGRLDIVADLAKRALDYYAGLPEALRTPQTERNRALALVRYGTALRTLGKIDEGRKAIDEAVAVLGRMREQGDLSEATTIGLSLGLTTQARLLQSLNQSSGALSVSARAAEMIRPVVAGPNASPMVRRAAGDVLNMHGYLQMVARNHEAALATLDEARVAYRSIGEQGLSDPSAAAGYAEATAWQVAANADIGRVDNALRAANEVLAVSGQVLEKRPGHMQALRAQALATSPLSTALKGDMRLAEALAAIETTERAWRELVHLDPGNTISWSNLGVAHLNKGFILESMGRLGDAAGASRAALELDRQVAPNLMLRSNLGIHAGRLAFLEALRGNRSQADQALALNERMRAWTEERLPAGSYERTVRRVIGGFWRTGVAHASGDYHRAIDAGREFTTQLEALEPPGDGARYEKTRLLSWTYGPFAESAYAVGDFETAERAILRSLEIRKSIQALGVEPDELRETAYQQAIAALVLERRGKHDEALALAAKALKFERDLAARNRDDPSQRFELANALFVAAAVGVGDRSAQLAEASTLIERLPPELQRARPVVLLRERIAEEKSRRRAG